MAKLSKEEIKEVENLIKNIKKNQYFDLRDSNHYQSYDISEETKEAIADACYYRLKDCIELLEELADL